LEASSSFILSGKQTTRESEVAVGEQAKADQRRRGKHILRERESGRGGRVGGAVTSAFDGFFVVK